MEYRRVFMHYRTTLLCKAPILTLNPKPNPKLTLTPTPLSALQLYQPVAYKAQRETYAWGTGLGYAYLTIFQVYKIVIPGPFQGKKYFNHFVLEVYLCPICNNVPSVTMSSVTLSRLEHCPVGNIISMATKYLDHFSPFQSKSFISITVNIK